MEYKYVYGILEIILFNFQFKFEFIPGQSMANFGNNPLLHSRDVRNYCPEVHDEIGRVLILLWSLMTVPQNE